MPEILPRLAIVTDATSGIDSLAMRLKAARKLSIARA